MTMMGMKSRTNSLRLIVMLVLCVLVPACKKEANPDSPEAKEERARQERARARDALEAASAQERKAKAEKDAAIVVPIETLVSAWDGNQLAADKTYLQKWVQTEGRVGSVFDSGGPTVWLDGPDNRKVVCGGVNGDQAAKLKVGSTIKIRGKVKGRLNTGGATSPHLTPCEIVEGP